MDNPQFNMLSRDTFVVNTLSLEMSGLKRPYLESLTTHELVSLADCFGIDIPFELDRIFMIEALMDIVTEYTGAIDGMHLPESGSEEPEKRTLIETDIPEPVALPKRYNITFIEVLIRDPLWVFTFWEIKSHDKERYEKAPDFGGYHLKVSPMGGGLPSQWEDIFIVPVGTGDTAWYLDFPPAEGHFKVDLCVLKGEEVHVLATSRPFRLPKLINPPNLGNELEEEYQEPLIRLSGAEDFPVLRNMDRFSCVKAYDDSQQAG
jgi:hypothetical protein